MTAWRRAIAILLLLLFAPATVLAAIPAQMCVGADGHRAIESRLAPKHHKLVSHAYIGLHEQSGVTHDPSSSATGYTTVADLGCVDIQLQVASQFAPRKNDDSNALRDMAAPAPAIPSYAQPCVVSALGDSAVQQRHAQGGVTHDPRLAIRATTVLRN